MVTEKRRIQLGPEFYDGIPTSIIFMMRDRRFRMTFYCVCILSQIVVNHQFYYVVQQTIKYFVRDLCKHLFILYFNLSEYNSIPLTVDLSLSRIMLSHSKILDDEMRR